MKKFFFLISLLLAGLVSISQTHYIVTGKVLDKNTKSPLAAASVFAQHTTFGVATDSEGNFKLQLPNGGYDLVVTFTGYETESMRISNASAGESILIEIKPKEKTMEEVSVVVSNEVKDGWQKYGQFFTDNFIGKSRFSKQSVIKNPEILKFFFSKKRNRLKVMAEEPLLVSNYGLGYTIKFAIDSFSYEYNSNVSQFAGYPLFEEMQGTAEQMETWRTNRMEAYNGSTLHFMRSLFNKELKQQGFEVQFLVKYNEIEKALPLKDMYAALHYSKDDSTNTVEFHPNQPDIILIYNKAAPEDIYLEYDSTAKKDFQVSTLTIAKDQSIIIEQNGYFFEQTDIISNGYLGFKKIGDMLPYDYKPE